MAITQILQRDTQLEAQRRGYLGLTLTDFEADTVSDIAVGSVIEIGGSLYVITTADEVVGGAPAAGVNYIYFLNDASGFANSNVAPTWSATRNGYYNVTNDRAIARFEYDNPDYLYKFIMDNDTERISRHGIDFDGYVQGAVNIDDDSPVYESEKVRFKIIDIAIPDGTNGLFITTAHNIANAYTNHRIIDVRTTVDSGGVIVGGEGFNGSANLSFWNSTNTDIIIVAQGSVGNRVFRTFITYI